MNRFGDTSMGGFSTFPATPWSGSVDSRPVLDDLLRIYWRPLYAHVRRRWARSNEEAKDLVQEFCLGLIDGHMLDRYDPARGRFRSFMRAALDNFVRTDLRARARLCRTPVPFSVEPATTDTPPDAFDRDWTEAVLDAAVRRVEAELANEGKLAYFDIFRAVESRDGRPSYDEVAKQCGCSPVDVSNRVQFVKRALRRAVAEIVRRSVGDGEAFRREMDFLTGEAS
jgi:RNA polymerase sigma factor (sigma-70 family)